MPSKLPRILVYVAIFVSHFTADSHAAAPIREFDGWITSVSEDGRSFTVRHNPTQYLVTLRTDGNTVFDRVRQAPLDAFPSDKPMRFWGAIPADGSAITLVGLRRADSDDQSKPKILPSQHNITGGRLLRENGKTYIDVEGRRVTVTVDPFEFGGFFEEKGDVADIAPGRQVHVRYEEDAQGGRVLSAVVTIALPRECRSPSPPSGATPEQVRQTFAEIKQLHEKIASELAGLMPVTMTVTPELAKLGEPIVLHMEAVAANSPNPTAVLYPNFFVEGMEKGQNLKLDWKSAGQRYGRTVYKAECPLPTQAPGSGFITWDCDIGGDIAQFSRYFAVIDDTYAVCSFLSTSHSSSRPGPDFHRLHLPYEEWISQPLVVAAVLQGSPQTWAAWSRESRQYGMKVNPHLFGPYWVRGTPPAPQANFQAESPELQRAVLSGYAEMLPWLGFGSIDLITAYTMDNSFSLTARELGYRTISSLCSGQNFMDGPMRINHFGMPDRPYFISPDDFRKAGPGGPSGLVGIPQCQRNTFLNREFNCTYCLEPAWNEYYNEGGGRSAVDDIWMSRMYDFFQAMLENRLSQKTPYFFSAGIEFNGNAPGIAEGNRLLIEYAAKKAETEPLVFATGPAVSDYYRRHFAKTPETSCYQQDYFGGLTKLDKSAFYPDTIEIEGPDFQSLFRAPDLLPAYHYDYQQPWNYPAWGNDDLPRNQWGYLSPGQHDPFQVVPKILDTRQFVVKRTDAANKNELTITLVVQAKADQKNLVLALWDIDREWRTGEGWWSVAGDNARFVPIRAPFTGNLNGVLVADVKTGENRFAVTISTPERTPARSTIKIGDSIEARVFQRDGQTMAYLWPTKPWNTAFTVNLEAGKHAEAFLAPAGECVTLTPGLNRIEIPAGRWLRIIGLSADELAAATKE